MLGAPRWLSAAVAAAAAAVSASPLLPPPPSCNLQGNWTSGVHPDPLRAALVHIEILQPEGSLDFTVKADWPGHAGFATAGRLAAGGASAWVYMVAPSGGVWDSSPVTASVQNNPNNVSCSALFNWCRFPYCAEHEPSRWPPWPSHPKPAPVPQLPQAEKLLSCADNSSLPCPLPRWEPTWDLARSTAMQACNLSGYFSATEAAQWGLVSFDALNAQAQWLDATPHDAEERLVEQCRRVKAVNNNTRCLIYRNTALALEWLSSQRRVMARSHADFFLRFQDMAGCDAAGPCTWAPVPGRPNYTHAGTLHGGPHCCPFDRVYCEQGGTTNLSHWRGQEQFFWNFSSTELQAWFVEHFFATNGTHRSPHVDGFFSDDVKGLPEEHPDAVARLGIRASELQALQRATQLTWNRAMERVVSEGGWLWQMFGASDYANAAPVVGGGSVEATATCSAQMRLLCSAESQKRPLLMGVAGNCCELPSAGDSGSASAGRCDKLVSCNRGGNHTLAAFLVTRPPFGYIGAGWLYCDSVGSPSKHLRDPLWNLNTGTPLEGCMEHAPGVFSRRWSGGLASLDCNTGDTLLDFAMKN
jgi:hypothetical protein